MLQPRAESPLIFENTHMHTLHGMDACARGTSCSPSSFLLPHGTMAGSHSCAPPLCSSDPGREKSIRACAPSAQHGRRRSLLHLLGEKAPFPRGELQSSGREWRRATTTGELPHGTPRKLLHGCTSQERQRAASPSEFPHWAPAGRAPTRLPGGGAEPQPATHRPRVCFLLLAFFWPWGYHMCGMGHRLGNRNRHYLLCQELEVLSIQ
jgi:hypothetical protein